MLSLLKKYLYPYRFIIGVVIVLQLTQALSGLFLPAINARIIDEGVAQGDVPVILKFGMFMLLASIGQITAQITAIWFGAKTAMSVGRDIRDGLFKHAINLSEREISKFGAPTLITRNTNDAQQVQMFVLMTMTMIMSAPLTMIGGVFMALREDVGLSWIILAAVLLLGAVVSVLTTQMSPLFQALQNKIDTINRILREQITGVRVIRAFNTDSFEKQKFSNANRDLTDTQISVGVRMALMFPTVFLVMNVSSVAIVWFGAFRILEGELQVGQMMAYLAYVTQILMSVMMSTMMLMMAPRALVSSRRINEVLNTPTSILEKEKPHTPKQKTGDIVFSDVFFSYPGAEEPVLKDVSLTIPAGKTTAIIGGTGSGKTTLANLIPRFFDVDSGSVRVSGTNVQTWSLESLWSAIGLVPQKTYLFQGTIRSNLLVAKSDANDEDLWHALKTAQAKDFVEKLPDGLDSQVNQGGTNLSGGQKQRLAIARALVSEPEILILDDSLSALDAKTDKALRAALKSHTKSMTVIVITQRVASLLDADQIVVLDAGKIAGIGTHEELLKTSKTYTEIVDSQMNKQGM